MYRRQKLVGLGVWMRKMRGEKKANVPLSSVRHWVIKFHEPRQGTQRDEQISEGHYGVQFCIY